MIRLFLLVFGILFISNCSNEPKSPAVEDPNEIQIPRLQPIKILYGSDSLQFGELRLPDIEGNAPIIMIIHGGCWLSSYNLTLMDSMSQELCTQGYATWNIEYRRTGDDGGAWPGTFLDVANALNHLKQLAVDYPIDLGNILVTGHSAGGHLALFLGTQNKLAKNSALKIDNLPNIKGIVSLAGITDLSTYYQPNGCGSNVKNLIGGLPNELPDRYTEASPISFVPLGIPQILVNGEIDNIVPISHITPYLELAQNKGEDIELSAIPGSGHFEVITPGSIAWPAIVEAFEKLKNK